MGRATPPPPFSLSLAVSLTLLEKDRRGGISLRRRGPDVNATSAELPTSYLQFCMGKEAQPQKYFSGRQVTYDRVRTGSWEEGIRAQIAHLSLRALSLGTPQPQRDRISEQRPGGKGLR